MKKAILGLLCSSFLFPLVGFAYEDGIYEVMNGAAKTVKYGDIEITVQMNDLSGYYYWGINDSFDSRCGSAVPSSYKDKIKNGKENNNARGGGDDNYKNGYDSGNNRKNRQGPCEDGRHVPSKGEWNNLLKARCLGGDNECDESKISYEGNGLIHSISLDDKGMIIGQFEHDFGIFDSYSRYWSSSRYPGYYSYGYDQAWAARSVPQGFWSVPRDRCYKVRCFKDEPDFTFIRKETKKEEVEKMKDIDHSSNCLDVIFNNGDSMCIRAYLDKSKTKQGSHDNVWGETYYTYTTTPMYMKITDKYLSEQYEPLCSYYAHDMRGISEKCDGHIRQSAHSIYSNGNSYKPVSLPLSIQYPQSKTQQISILTTPDEEQFHYDRVGRFEWDTGVYDIINFEPTDQYYLGNKQFGLKKNYLTITEVSYSSNNKERQNITNNWKDYVMPGFSKDKLVYNTSINIINNGDYSFVRELYVKKAGFYKISYKYLTHERKEGTSSVVFNAPVVTTKFKNGKNDEGNKNNEMETNKQNNQEAHIDYNKTQNNHNHEFNDAYDFAFKNGITTANNINQADMNGGLTRIAMAKMLSQYAINILGKTPDTSKTPNFSDVSIKIDTDYSNGTTLAYQLGIMGMGLDKFRPHDTVTRAEFGTALSRMLFGLSDGNDYYYSTHLAKLKSEGIINNDNPNLKEQRGYVMLMLMRSAK